MTLGKFLNLSELQFSHCKKGEGNSTFLIQRMGLLNELKHGKPFRIGCGVCNKCLMTLAISFYYYTAHYLSLGLVTRSQASLRSMVEVGACCTSL